jgi:hypothetical protein
MKLTAVYENTGWIIATEKHWKTAKIWPDAISVSVGLAFIIQTFMPALLRVAGA